MRKSRFSEEQIIGMLKEHLAGMSVAELCRKHRISDATFYKWRSKFGGMEVSDAKKLQSLEDENARLKRLLADAMLDVSTLREMLGKTSDAQGAETGCELGNHREGVFTEAGLRAGQACAEDLPLCLHAAGRRGATGDAPPPQGSLRHPRRLIESRGGVE